MYKWWSRYNHINFRLGERHPGEGGCQDTIIQLRMESREDRLDRMDKRGLARAPFGAVAGPTDKMEG